MNVRHVALAGVLAALGVPAAVAADGQTTLAPSQYARTVWTEMDGLASSSVLALAQTPDRFIWAGTEEGLVRFDGLKF
ncbi:MAG: hypothetical protein M3R55_16745, partial [Acidobacteriota bacterium]|nr:hypothetical protein [Acidobacteriota bacterium]MDQ3171327.1 hypothetical protein [Acidobacteriota bacterium]